MHCKSLWIKASAKYKNVNENQRAILHSFKWNFSANKKVHNMEHKIVLWYFLFIYLISVALFKLQQPSQ